MTDQDTDSEKTFEEIVDELMEEQDQSKSTSRKVLVDPQSTELTPTEFHVQDWLLITEALYKTTTLGYSYTNFFEGRRQYARSLVPIIAAEAGISSGNIFEYIDPEWGEIEPSKVDPSREFRHTNTIQIDSSDAERDVDSFTELDWLIIAEAMNAWIADLHLGSPNNPPRGGDRVETLMNAAVSAAGYTNTNDILPLVRNLFEQYQHGEV